MVQNDWRWQESLSASVEHTQDAVIVTDACLEPPGPTIVYANPAFTRLTGYPLAEVIGRNPRMLQGPDTEQEVLARLRDDLRAGRIFRGHTINYRKDGTPFLMGWHVFPLSDDAGSVHHYLSIQRAVIDRPAAHSAFDDAEGLRREALPHASLVTLLLDEHSGTIVDANASAEAFYGVEPGALADRPFAELSAQRDVAFRFNLDPARRHARSYFDFHHGLANGRPRAVTVHLAPVTVGGRARIHALVEDVSEHYRLADAVQHQLLYDQFAALPNRRRIHEHLRNAIEQAEARDTRCALMHVGLDGLREFNACFGDAGGDALLREAAARIRVAVADCDLVARLGRDELAIIVTAVAADKRVGDTAHAICTLLRRPLSVLNRPVRLSASVGVSVFPDHGGDAAALARCAGAALLQAKSDGGDRWTQYDPRRLGRTGERLLLGSDLGEALDTNELQVAFQPVVRLSDARVIGVEALARWHHAEQGWVPPERFVPIAEATGQAEALGERILRAAASRVMARSDQHDGLQLAVNVSVHQLRDPRFTDVVCAVLVDSGLPPGRLELEITEAAFIDESPSIIERLRLLRGLGVGIAIDDFGTGFSSLQYLKWLPINHLKIDRNFVAGIDADADNQAIVAAIVNLARQFRLAVTAEGVETAAEAAQLRALDCDCAQGLYFASPGAIEDVIAP